MSKIKITFPDGNIKEFDSGITAYSIAESISGRLAKESLAAKVSGAIFDLYRPLTDDAEIQFLTFNEDEGKEVYWHSTSHLMAHAVQEIYPEAKFGVGPAIDAGFYYDIDINSI
jgi:threonyl-tRNA synthetase